MAEENKTKVGGTKRYKDFIFAVGRRRSAVARLRLYIKMPDGLKFEEYLVKKGDIVVNGKNIREYFSGKAPQAAYEKPFKVTNSQNKYAVTVKIVGGGQKSQLGAFVLALSRALAEVDEASKPILRKSKLLTRDPREEKEEKWEWVEKHEEGNSLQRGKPMSTPENGYILLKIGGSSITDKNIPYKLRKNVISRLAKEISQSNCSNMIISHGSGSFGHTSAMKYGGMKGYKSRIGVAKVFQDASRINEIMTEALVKEGIPAVSIRPRGIVLANNGREYDNYFQIIEEMLNQGLVPVICGDVIMDKSWKTTIFSGEKTLNLLALYLKRKGFKIEKIIQIGETDGFLDDKGKTIPEINSKNWKKIKKNIFKTKKMDVTGGMEHKVEEGLELSKKGIKTILISDKENNLSSAIIGKQIKSTLIN